MNLFNTNTIVILHLVFLPFFLGGQLFYLFILQPVSYRFFTLNEQILFLKNVLKRQNPVLLFALCLVVLTGGFMITPLKGSLGTSYFSAFGSKLVVKLGYFFLVFFITAYQTLAIGFKIRYLDPANTDSKLRQTLGSVRRQMTITTILNVSLTIYVIYLARNL